MSQAVTNLHIKYNNLFKQRIRPFSGPFVFLSHHSIPNSEIIAYRALYEVVFLLNAIKKPSNYITTGKREDC